MNMHSYVLILNDDKKFVEAVVVLQETLRIALHVAKALQVIL